MDYEEIEIRKRIEEAKKTKYCAKQQMAQADIQIGEYDLQLWELNSQKEKEIAEEKANHERKSRVVTAKMGCFREYGKLYSVPIFKDVTPNGTIQLSRGYAKNYDIHTILQLKELIPLTDEYPTFMSLKKAVGSKADQVTIKRCCFVIEHGGADHIINKWNNMTPKFDRLGQVI